MRMVQLVANGISTDHPVPGLAFVDDTHIPLDDPRQIEAVGRHKGEDRWGRWDGPGDEQVFKAEWWAFTTDPDRTELAWCVRYHPEHGRTVVLVNDEDASSLHTNWSEVGGPLLFRAGGYWWDGHTWYRPAQVFDWAAEKYARRKAAAATTVTAAALLEGTTANPARAELLTVANLDRFGDLGREKPPITVPNWPDHLALWAARRPRNARALTECVVNLSAPELAGDQLIGAAEMAEMAGVGASTLRAYASRGEAELPDPQTVISGRNAWSKPVAADWIEARNRSADGITASMTTSSDDRLPVGLTDIRERYATAFFRRLWDTPLRKRWSLRNKDAARQLADELAWLVANDVRNIIPVEPLATTISAAILKQFARDIYLATSLNDGERPEKVMVAVQWQTAKMFDWLVRHHPSMASHTIGDIVGEAQRELDLPRRTTIQALRSALVMDGKLPDEGYDAFFDRAFPPEDE